MDNNRTTCNGFILDKKKFNDNTYKISKEQLRYSHLLSSLLATRNIDLATDNDIIKFIDPKIKYTMPHPFTFGDMDSVVQRAITAILNNHKVCLFGDYDVDGSTSCALLSIFFSKINFTNFIIYIPDRVKEGYGPNVEAIKKLKEQSVELIIMLDCGTLAFEPVNKATECNIDVIILDHHKSLDTIPQCVGIVNPNRIDINNKLSSEESKTYCACTIALLFIIGIQMELSKAPNNNNYKQDIMSLVYLAGIATVCDVMPIVGFNRALAVNAINNMRSNAGIARLLELANIPLDQAVSNYHIGFVVGPMINAGGRIGESSIGANLLSSNDHGYIQILSHRLYTLNQERMSIEKNILNEIATIENIKEKVHANGFFFEYHSEWHEGVIGIISARMKDKYYRPAITGSFNNSNGIIKCSARSVGNINIGEVVLKALKNNLILYGGGHKSAAGFSLHIDQCKNLEEFLQQELKAQSDYEYNHRTIYYDIEINDSGIDMNLLDNIIQLEPFGYGNDKITLKVKFHNLLSAKIIKDKHITLQLLTSMNKMHYAIAFNAVGFPFGNYLLSRVNKAIELLITIHEEKFNGKRQLKIIAIDAIEWS